MKKPVFLIQAKSLMLTGLLLLSVLILQAQTNFYWNGSGAVTATASWGTNTNGSGTNPNNFTTANQIFNIQNAQSATLGGTWTISGAGSKLLIKTGGTFTTGANNPTLTLDMESGGTYIMSNTTYSNLAFGSLDNNSTFQLNNTSGFRATLTYPNLTLNFSGAINPGATNVTVNGNLTMNNGAEFRGTTTGTPTHTVGGNVVINSGGIWTTSNGAGTPTYNISGTIQNSGSIAASASNGTSAINLNGSNSVTVTWGTKSGNNHNVTIAGTKTVTFGDNFAIATGTLTVNGTLNCGTTTISGAGTFTLASGGTLGIGSTAGITSSGATGNVQTTTRNFNTGANYTYNGSAAQATGSGLPATVNNLTVNNSGGAVTLTNGVTVSGVLTLTSGLLTTGANTVIANSNATGAVSGGSSTAYVDGNLRRSIAAGANSYSFPIGTSTAYAPVTIDFTSGTVAGTLTGSTTNGDHPNIGSSTFISTSTVNRHWTFTVNSGLTTANYNATFNWPASGDTDGGFAFASAACGEYSGGSWNYPTMGATTATSAQITGTSGFSDFQVGNLCIAPDVPTVSASLSPICTGASSTLSINSGNLNSATAWTWYSGSCGGTPAGTGTSVIVSPGSTTTYFVRGEGGCVTPGSCASQSITVVADPAAPTAVKSPNLASVCEGTTLTLTGVTDNGGGTGSCSIEYRYDNGSGFSSWSATLPNFAAVAGTNTIEIRKNCDGSGCDLSSVNSYSWTVNAPPSCSINGASGACSNSVGNVYSVTGSMTLYNWSVTGNGSIIGSSSGSSITVTAGASGYYAVNVTITDANGCISNCSKTVTINAPPSCSISGADFVCSNSTGNIYTAPAGMNAYNWSISGSGSIPGSTTGQSVSVTAGNSATDYTVEVTITDANGCVSSCSKQSFVIFIPPPANITINPNPACFGVTLNLSIMAQASSTISWSGEGITNSTGNPSTTAIPTTTGPHTYSVTVISSDYFGSCINTGTATVNVNPLPACSVTGASSACANSTGNIFSAPAGMSMYSWSVTGSGSVSGSATGSSVSVTAGSSGSFTVYVTVTDGNGCSSSCSKIVNINPAPACSITFVNPPPWGQDTTCSNSTGNIYSAPAGMSAYNWSISGSGTITSLTNGSSVSVTAGATGSYTLFVTVTNANGCTSTCNDATPIKASPTCSVSGPSAVCSNSTGNVHTVTSNGTSFVWSISGDGTIAGPTTGSSVTVTAGASGSYTISVTSTSFNACTSTCSQVVTVNNTPTPTITGPASVCSGGSVMLDAGAGYTTYAWSNGGGSGQTATFSSITSPATYTVTVTANGCTGSDTHGVTVTANPTPVITGPATVCFSGSVMLDAGAGYSSYAWSNGGGSGQTATFSNINATTTYTVTVTNSGCSGTDTHLVTAQSCIVEFSGKVIFSNNNTLGVKDAAVNLTGSVSGSNTTNVNGDYMITTAVTFGNFTLKPVKNINRLNGVTVADVTAIQQHAVNSVPITDNYKKVAADVNKSNSITSTDATLLNQALLGAVAAPFNTSWRFVPTSHVMANPPWGFPEQRTYTGISGLQANQDFYGIKIGDVATTFANPANFGAGQPLTWRLDDRLLESGAEVTAVFSADQMEDLASFQFALHFDPAQLQLVAIEPLSGLPVTIDHFGTYHVSEGEIRMVWSQVSGMPLAEAAPVFQLRFKALNGGAKLSEVLQLDEEVLPGYSYNTALEESKVELVYSELTGTGTPSAVNGVQLLQNRPNPFNGTTQIGFILPAQTEAELRVTDVTGRVLFSQKKQYAAGRHEETLRLEGASGVLSVELVTEWGSVVRKMMAVR